MDGRSFLAASALASFEGFSLSSATVSQVFDVNQATNNGNARQPVLLRSGYTRTSDGTDERAASQSGMFDIEVVRSSDSEGRLASLCFLRETTTHIAALLFTCITSRMSGFTSWPASSLPR